MNPNLLMACVTGSQLYGTNRPDSDTDIRGICLQPVKSILGLQGFEQYMPEGREAECYTKEAFGIPTDDVTIYGVSKFIQLTLNNNPNIIELLYVPESHMLHTTPTWEWLSGHRNQFISTKVIHSLAGYAYSQLVRIKRHYRWLHNPPTKPRPTNYGMFQSEAGGQHWEDNTMKKAYQKDLEEYQHYKVWRKERNPARALLEEKYGYDTKHASHLYRLVLEAVELVTTGNLSLPLRKADKTIVLAVLYGEVTYEQVLEMGENAKGALQKLEETSPLPHTPNHKFVEDLLIEINLRTVTGGYNDKWTEGVSRFTTPYVARKLHLTLHR